MKKILYCGLALGVLTTIVTANARAADPIADLNLITETTIKAVGHPLPVTAVEYAIVQLAVYDAVESIDQRFQPYNAYVPGATGSMTAAAAKATRDALIGLFSAQTSNINNAYQSFLTTYGIDPSDPGIAVGTQAAAAILVLRTNDGRFPSNPPPFLGNTAIGQWRPTPSFLPAPPPSNSPGLVPWLANVTPLTMKNDSQFRVDPPPDLTSSTWAEDYNETMTLGAFNSTVRTPEQTDIGYFWADSGPLLWQNSLRYISTTYLDNIGDSARMFALAETALADAQIACWDSKYYYNFWRPITAISLGDQDGNPDTIANPNWQPLINTPNFPEYPSGHATISGATSHALALFFGTDQVAFQMTTTNPKAQQKTRTFARFSDAESEVIDARVYVGIHYRNSDQVARAMGLRVADWVFKNYFRPVGDPRFGQ